MQSVTRSLLSLIALGVVQLGFQASGQVLRTRTEPVDKAVEGLLQDANVPGGMEVVVGCDAIPAVTYQIAPTGLGATLQSISEQNKSVTWQEQQGTYSVRIQVGTNPVIASIQVPQQQIKVRTLGAAVDVLLTNAVVRDQVSKSGYRELPSRIGFSSPLEGEEKVINIPSGRLDTALNIIGKAFGVTAWKLYEQNCKHTRVYQITWILQ